MVDKKTIGVTSLITLGIVFGSMIGLNFFDEPKYYCEERPELGLIQCDHFSKYVAENGKCVRNKDTNLICRGGWKLVVDDTILPEEPESSIGHEGIGREWVCGYGKPCVERLG